MGSLLLLAYSGEACFKPHTRGIILACSLVIAGLGVVRSRLVALATCMRVIAIRLLLACLIKPDTRVLSLAGALSILAVTLIWIANRRESVR